MATGLQTKLTGQIGEHLVTAELGRRGIIATPFAGNVPDIDILAYANNNTIAIQVKTITPKSPSWQFSIKKFLDIDIIEGDAQIVLGKNSELNKNIICVFVSLGDNLGEDEFYIFKLGWLQKYFLNTYKPRKLPKTKNLKSPHCAIFKTDMKRQQRFLNNWALIKKELEITS